MKIGWVDVTSISLVRLLCLKQNKNMGDFSWKAMIFKDLEPNSSYLK